MEAPRNVFNRRKRRSTCLWITTGIVALVVLIVVIVPTAVVFSRPKAMAGTPAAVLVPLYIYPNGGAWDPLYKAINSTSNLNFIVVVNPESGPGNDSLPPKEFIPAIQQLNSYPNVQTVGYVRTGYGTRNLSDVIEDVQTYSNWPNHAANLAMHGIFFDEAASEDAPGVQQGLYRINEAAKSAPGINTPKTVIHNPGVVPSSSLYTNNTDIVVTFEESYKEYRNKQSSLEQSPVSRGNTSYIVHSLPGSVDQKNFVRQISYRAQYLFVTTNKDNDFYESFGKSWQRFVEDVPT